MSHVCIRAKDFSTSLRSGCKTNVDRLLASWNSCRNLISSAGHPHEPQWHAVDRSPTRAWEKVAHNSSLPARLYTSFFCRSAATLPRGDDAGTGSCGQHKVAREKKMIPQ